MPTPSPGTFQNRNSISFSQIASEFNQVDDGTREIKLSDYYSNNGIVAETSTTPIIHEDFDGSTTPTISNDLVHSEFNDTGVSETSDISGTGMSNITWTNVGNVTGLKIAKMYRVGTGTAKGTNDLVPTVTFVSNDTGHYIRFRDQLNGQNPISQAIIQDWQVLEFFGFQSTSYGNRPNNWFNEIERIPSYVTSPIGGTDNWVQQFSLLGGNQTQYCNYLYANGTTAGGCGTTASAVSGMTSVQLNYYVNGYSHGVLGARVTKVYNYFRPAGVTPAGQPLRMQRFYQLKNSRKTIDGVATATATGVIV